MVVEQAPVLDDGLGLLQGVEDLTVEQLVAYFAVEALVEAVPTGSLAR